MAPLFKPGMSWPDMQASAPIDQVLADAREQALIEVAVVGRAKDGDIIVFGSHPNADAVMGLLMRGVHWLAIRDQLQEEVGNGEDRS